MNEIIPYLKFKNLSKRLNKSYYHSVTDLKVAFLACTTSLLAEANYNNIDMLQKLLFCAMTLSIIFNNSVCY